MVFQLPVPNIRWQNDATAFGTDVRDNDEALAAFLNNLAKTTPGSEGARLIGVHSSAYKNFSKARNDVAAALDGIDNALGQTQQGLNVLTTGYLPYLVDNTEDLTVIATGTNQVTVQPFRIYDRSGKVLFELTTPQTVTVVGRDNQDRIDYIYVDLTTKSIPGQSYHGTAAPLPVAPSDALYTFNPNSLIIAAIFVSFGLGNPVINQSDVFNMLPAAGDFTRTSGQPNMLVNGSFENFTDNIAPVNDVFDGWVNIQDGTITGNIQYQTAIKYVGDGCPNIQITNSTGAGNIGFYQPTLCDEGRCYTVQGHVYLTNCNCDAEVFLGVQYEWKGVTYELNAFNDKGIVEIDTGGFDITGYSNGGEWIRVFRSFIFPIGATNIKKKFYVRATKAGSTLNCYVDGFKLEPGATPSEFDYTYQQSTLLKLVGTASDSSPIGGFPFTMQVNVPIVKSHVSQKLWNIKVTNISWIGSPFIIDYNTSHLPLGNYTVQVTWHFQNSIPSDYVSIDLLNVDLPTINLKYQGSSGFIVGPYNLILEVSEYKVY